MGYLVTFMANNLRISSFFLYKALFYPPSIYNDVDFGLKISFEKFNYKYYLFKKDFQEINNFIFGNLDY